MGKETGVKDSTILASTAEKIYSGMIAIFMCIILAVFPLYYRNYYFDILVAKYQFYWISAVILLVLCLLVSLVLCFVDFMEYGGVNTKKFFRNFTLKNLRKQPFVYKGLALFWLFAAIATVTSDYLYESFWGNEGRYSGLFLITLYVLTAVVIGKLGRFRQWYLDLFLFSSILVCLFGITDYFRMDLLGWKVDVEPSYADLFTSTLGNVNTYTAYVGMVVGVSCSLFVTEKNYFRGIWYYIAVIISFFALVTGQSDNAYLALGILFASLPFFLFSTGSGVVRYGVLAASFMTVIQMIDMINQKMAGSVLPIYGIFNVLTNYKHLELIVFTLWLVVAVLFFIRRTRLSKGKTDVLGRRFTIAWGVLIGAAVAVVLYILYDANFGANPEKYGSIAHYVVFNDTWGTNRGYCWRIAWEAYMDQPLIHKLFGFGPDTFGILTWGYREEAIELYNVYYESAHNEYLQILVTMGPFTLISYVLFLCGGCVTMIRRWKETPWILAACMAVLCYAAQAMVNINLPIATPVMWAILGLGLSASRNKVTKVSEAD